MEDDAGEEEVGEGSFGSDAVEIGFVQRIALNAQTSAQDEGSHAGDEARQEGVEGKGADEAAINELHHARDQDVAQVGVDQLELGRRRTRVLFQETAHHAEDAALLRLRHVSAAWRWDQISR